MKPNERRADAVRRLIEVVEKTPMAERDRVRLCQLLGDMEDVLRGLDPQVDFDPHTPKVYDPAAQAYVDATPADAPPASLAGWHLHQRVAELQLLFDRHDPAYQADPSAFLQKLIRNALGRGTGPRPGPAGPPPLTVHFVNPHRSFHHNHGPLRGRRGLTLAVRFAVEDGVAGWWVGWAWRCPNDAPRATTGRRHAYARTFDRWAPFVPGRLDSPPWRAISEAFGQSLLDKKPGHPVIGSVRIRALIVADLCQGIAAAEETESA